MGRFDVFVRPHIYRCSMSNGAEFQVTSLFRLSRREAREALLTVANGDYPEKDGVVIYTSSDIASFWQARS